MRFIKWQKPVFPSFEFQRFHDLFLPSCLISLARSLFPSPPNLIPLARSLFSGLPILTPLPRFSSLICSEIFFLFFELRFAPQAGTHAAKPVGLRAKHEGASCVRQIIASDWFSRQAISRVRPSLSSRKFLTRVKNDCAIPASGRFPLQTGSCFGQRMIGYILASGHLSRQAISLVT